MPEWARPGLEAGVGSTERTRLTFPSSARKVAQIPECLGLTSAFACLSLCVCYL